ncbi:MAG: 4-hydroxythreonine-4-phosphate dehydrogenase PdxA [Flavobacteriaceae bacterium]
MTANEKIKVGISVGDLNGIGMEVILKTFQDKRMMDFCVPVIYASSKVISYHKKALNLNIPIFVAKNESELNPDKINCIQVWQEDVAMELGKPSKEIGEFAFKSLDAATQAVKQGKVDFLLTAPINKDNIFNDDFQFPGHTEYLGEQFEGEPLMLLTNGSLRLGLITGHIPISKVSETIDEELIKKKVEIMNMSLKQDFGIDRPKIAVLGINPHCGDKGVIGSEDEDLVRPTINKIKEETKTLVFGPYAADGFFGSRAYEEFDGVLAMYHDQGLAPFKTIAFGNGVNFTAGLKFIRTSPDHGTGYAIAGLNQANPDSFKEALYTGLELVKLRKNYQDLTRNVLKTRG